MSNRKRGQPQSTAAGRKKKKQSSGTSWIIPVVAGVVVVAIIIGAIISIEKRPAAANISVPVVTTQPQSAGDIPFPAVPRISVNDTQDLLAEGQVVVIDVRASTSYQQSHIAGAISIPEAEMSARMNDLPRDKDIVLYCT
jgi:hypothetical protein